MSRDRARPKRYTVTVNEPFDRKRYQQAAHAYGLTMDEFFRWGGDYLVILLDKWEGWK